MLKLRNGGGQVGSNLINTGAHFGVKLCEPMSCSAKGSRVSWQAAHCEEAGGGMES